MRRAYHLGDANFAKVQPKMSTEIPNAAAIEARMLSLAEEHRDLDHAINLMVASAVPDELQLRRMKKRKLLLKDQISFLQRQLSPDILA